MLTCCCPCAFLSRLLLLLAAAAGLALPAAAQNFRLAGADYMDTTRRSNPACSAIFAQYYSLGVDAKYPRSSATLLHEAQRFLAARAKPYTGSGYVTFRFVIDCEGQMLPRVQVLQTNEAYQPFQFDKQLVADLFAYLKTLNQWKKALDRNDTPINYIAFLSFKLRDGKVAAIIP